MEGYCLKCKAKKEMKDVKEVLIRSIQTAEGNFPCFATAKDFCDQMSCCWRNDCLPK